MSSPDPAPRQTTINLVDVANKYLDALQRVYDIVSYSLASFRKINEADYDEFSRQLQVMPRQQARMDFEKAKESSQQWILRNSLSDALNLVVPLLEDCRTICELCDYKVANKENAEELQAITGKNRVAFLQLPVAEKLKLLQERFAIRSEVHDHVLGLIEIARILVTSGAPTDKEIQAKIRTVQIVQAPGTNAAAGTLNLTRQIADTERTFKPGEKISFSKAEHIGSIITVGIFITQILQGIQEYGRKTGAAAD